MSTLKVLVVDDSNAVRVRISQILRSARYEVLTACDGAEAMELLHKENPRLMILDVKMPNVDGYGVCEQLNRLRASADVPPVVFLTSVNSKALELLGHEYGAYMQKPVEPEQLLSVVGEQIEKACA
ncbi:MAG: response regulator [Planctomycetota bacterium]